ncbi:LOW QUALITY PROTEIN: DNA_pol_E_B domain-containing protein, partial [Cephalotus follicularis]
WLVYNVIWGRQINESTVQNAEMDGFFMHLQNKHKEALIKDEPGLHIYLSRDVDMILNDEDDSTKEVIPDTPTDKHQSLYSEQFDSAFKENHSTGKPSKIVTPFGKRTSKFVVKFSINKIPNAENGNTEHDHENPEDDIIKRVQPRKRCSLIVHGSGPKPGRFMYDRIEDKFNTLEKRIRKHANARHSWIFEEPMDPTRSIFAVGMIYCDGEGHLNEKSIFAEHSGGQRVCLDLHKSQFYLFPGQVVGIEGQNPSGHCLIASKRIDSIPFTVTADEKLHPAKKVALGQEILSADVPYTQKEISKVLLPQALFTTIDNLLFEPLTELLAYATRFSFFSFNIFSQLGPFIDSEHPEIKKGTTDRNFDEIFGLEILQRLQDHAEYMGSDSRVILVPSIRDANHDLVFLQMTPIFDINLPNLKYKITSLTNPGNFEANKVKVGCCTVDVIKQLSGEEISQNSADGAPSGLISRLASHILNQRRHVFFYALYPPVEIVPLDFLLAPEALDISSVPDILIIPSDMKYFIKVLSLGGKIEGEEPVKSICVNPGRLAKGEGGGTFIELNYQGSPEMMNASIIGI